MENVRDILNDFMNGVNTISKEEGMTVQAFMSLQNAAFEASALDVKTKELISVGIAAYNHQHIGLTQQLKRQANKTNS